MAKKSDADLTDKPIRPTDHKKQTPKQYDSGDGIRRLPDAERKLNEAFALTFKGAAGQLVADYLRSISTNRIIGPGAPENAYAYHEGARWLMGIIDKRRMDGEEKKP